MTKLYLAARQALLIPNQQTGHPVLVDLKQKTLSRLHAILIMISKLAIINTTEPNLTYDLIILASIVQFIW